MLGPRAGIGVGACRVGGRSKLGPHAVAPARGEPAPDEQHADPYRRDHEDGHDARKHARQWLRVAQAKVGAAEPDQHRAQRDTQGGAKPGMSKQVGLHPASGTNRISTRRLRARLAGRFGGAATGCEEPAPLDSMRRGSLRSRLRIALTLRARAADSSKLSLKRSERIGWSSVWPTESDRPTTRVGD